MMQIPTAYIMQKEDEIKRVFQLSRSLKKVEITV
jgi:hypothetical protein